MFIQNQVCSGACECICCVGLVLPRMASVPFTTTATDNQKDREQDQRPPDKDGQEDQQEDIAILCPWWQRDVLGKHQRNKQTSHNGNSFSEYNRMTSIFTLYRFLQFHCPTFSGLKPKKNLNCYNYTDIDINRRHFLHKSPLFKIGPYGNIT